MGKYIRKVDAYRKIIDIISACYDEEYNESEIAALRKAANAISIMPAADVQLVRRGRWEEIADMDINVCSECADQAYWDAEYGQQLFDYCPNCGAKMDLKDGDAECPDTE